MSERNWDKPGTGMPKRVWLEHCSLCGAVEFLKHQDFIPYLPPQQFGFMHRVLLEHNAILLPTHNQLPPFRWTRLRTVANNVVTCSWPVGLPLESQLQENSVSHKFHGEKIVYRVIECSNGRCDRQDFCRWQAVTVVVTGSISADDKAATPRYHARVYMFASAYESADCEWRPPIGVSLAWHTQEQQYWPSGQSATSSQGISLPNL